MGDDDVRVCIHGTGTVVHDDRKPTPYQLIDTCMVGEPVERDGVTYLRGWSFVTRIDREDERWPRDEAPESCPRCAFQDAARGLIADQEPRP